MISRTTRLHVEQLEARDVPAVNTFYFIGDISPDANDKRNYKDVNDQTAPRVPTTGDRIVINSSQQRTMVIFAGNSISCDSFAFMGARPLSELLNPNASTTGHVLLEGPLNLTGITAGGDPQSSIMAGTVEIDGPKGGRLNLSGSASMTYGGGQIDTINNNTGYIYVFDSATLKLTADPGQIGAKIFVGRNEAGVGSPGFLKLDTTGNMTFYRDATIGLASPGNADLIRGGLKLFNMGGQAVETGTGWYENYGTTTVNGDILSEMHFSVLGGTVTIASLKTLNVTGFKTLADNSKASFLTGPGSAVLKPEATLQVAERYYSVVGGSLLCDDTGVANAQFYVSGNVDINGGTLQMGTADNTFGSLLISGSLRFGGTSWLNIHVSGTQGKVDTVTANSVTLVQGCSVGARTTGTPPVTQSIEREFLFTAGGVAGDWTNLVMTGDFTNWLMHSSNKKLTFSPPGGGGGGEG